MSRATTAARAAEESLIQYLTDPDALQARLDELRATIAECDRKLAGVGTLQELEALRAQAAAKLQEASDLRAKVGEQMTTATRLIEDARAQAEAIVSEARAAADAQAAEIRLAAEQDREAATRLLAEAKAQMPALAARESAAAQALAEAERAGEAAERTRQEYDTKLQALRAMVR